MLHTLVLRWVMVSSLLQVTITGNGLLIKTGVLFGMQLPLDLIGKGSQFQLCGKENHYAA